jgi:hypothetical protein
MDGCIDGWMDGWMERWMERWIIPEQIQTNKYTPPVYGTAETKYSISISIDKQEWNRNLVALSFLQGRLIFMHDRANDPSRAVARVCLPSDQLFPFV